MHDEQEGHSRWAGAMLLVAFIVCLFAVAFTVPRFLEHRAQLLAAAKSVEKIDTAAPIEPPSNGVEKINTPAEPPATLSVPCADPAGCSLDLRPSTDLPQESSRAENEESPAISDLGREIEERAAEISPVHAGDDHRHARRRAHHLRHRRDHHRVDPAQDCDGLCRFFKAVARLAGAIN